MMSKNGPATCRNWGSRTTERSLAVVNETGALVIEEMLFQSEGVGVLRAERRIGINGACERSHRCFRDLLLCC